MDALEAVGDPELRAALLFARAQARAITADDLASAHEIHRNVARSRLERLAEAGLLVPGYERRSGKSGPGGGRPAKTYAVAPEHEAIEFPARHYETLVGLLLDALPGSPREAGAEFGARLAQAAGLRPSRRRDVAFERMCRAVRRLGFQASVAELTSEHAEIATPTCPLRSLVRLRPDAAELDRGMWAGLAAEALAGVEVDRVECETRNCLDDHASCSVLIRLREP